MNRTEYPLFTQARADLCPSARYVGGTSRWLCECSKPRQCLSYLYARGQDHAGYGWAPTQRGDWTPEQQAAYDAGFNSYVAEHGFGQ